MSFHWVYIFFMYMIQWKPEKFKFSSSFFNCKILLRIFQFKSDFFKECPQLETFNSLISISTANTLEFYGESAWSYFLHVQRKIRLSFWLAVSALHGTLITDKIKIKSRSNIDLDILNTRVSNSKNSRHRLIIIQIEH